MGFHVIRSLYEAVFEYGQADDGQRGHYTEVAKFVSVGCLNFFQQDRATHEHYGTTLEHYGITLEHP